MARGYQPLGGTTELIIPGGITGNLVGIGEGGIADDSGYSVTQNFDVISNELIPDVRAVANYVNAEILGALKIVGNWNATTNDPLLANGDEAEQGTAYVVNPGGTQNLGNGSYDYKLRDIVYKAANGDWDVIPAGDYVLSLNSLLGALTLAGTTNQVTITSNGINTLTFSLPQNINSGAAPTFAGTNFTGIPNSATTATNANTASAIVSRDASGNFSAGNITASLSGNATTATSATNATNAVNVATTATTTNATYYLTFVASNSSSNQTMRMATAMTYNPSTGIFAVPEAIIPELTVNSTAGSNLPFQVISNSPQNNNSYYGMSIEKNDGAMLSGNQIGTINYRGERGDGVGTSVRITAWASENWSPTLIGSYLTVDVVPTGTSTRTQALRIGNIGGSNINSQFFGSVTATAFLGNATSATTATNIAGGTATQILVQTAAGATSFITAPVNGEKTYTRWNGTSYDNTTPFGWYSYQDTASSVTPITVPANTDTVLPNNALGTSTTTTYAVTGISTVWNSTTNRFDFTGLAPGDMVNVRVTISVTTTAPNQNVDVRFNGAIGGSPPFTLVFASIQFKTVGTHSIAADVVVAMYNTNTTNNPASISVLSDDACDVVVNTFLVSVNRR